MARVVGSFDDLADSVRQAANLRARDRVKEARARAKRMEHDARERGEQIKTEVLAAARRQADEERSQRLAEAMQAARRKRLAAREDVLDRVWDQAERKLRDMVDDDQYVEVLRRLTWLAFDILGPGRLTLAADLRGHDLLTEDRLRAWSEASSEEVESSVELERASEPLDAWGGIVVTKHGGRKRMDARFCSRLQTARRELRDEVFNRLMGES